MRSVGKAFPLGSDLITRRLWLYVSIFGMAAPSSFCPFFFKLMLALGCLAPQNRQNCNNSELSTIPQNRFGAVDRHSAAASHACKPGARLRALSTHLACARSICSLSFSLRLSVSFSPSPLSFSPSLLLSFSLFSLSPSLLLFPSLSLCRVFLFLTMWQVLARPGRGGCRRQVEPADPEAGPPDRHRALQRTVQRLRRHCFRPCNVHVVISQLHACQSPSPHMPCAMPFFVGIVLDHAMCT